MKFVFLNRDLLNAPLVSRLRKAGHGVFVCAEIREADLVLKLHGRTISLVMGHDQPGLELLSAIKSSSRFSSIPFFLTHSSWTSQKFAEHQKGPESANAYAKYPASEDALLKIFDQILGTTLANASDVAPVSDLSAIGLVEAVSPTLEEATTLYQGPGVATEGGITIDLPLMPAAPSTEPTVAPLADLAPTAAEIPSPLADPDALPPLAEPTQMQMATPRETTASSEIDADALAQMPYLQTGGKGVSPLAYAPPLNDALVPGGAAQSPDVETLKRYLLLREQDVLALSAQLKQARDQVANLEQNLRHERAVNTEFAHLAQEQGKRIENFEKEKEISAESAQEEIEELKFELKRRNEKAKLLEHQIRDATAETERLKERVRLDIRKIRSREKELENRLEIMKKDSEALLSAREQKIVELKRKLDLTEFNMDLLQDQLEKEKTLTAQLKAKLERAAQVVRVAGGLLHPSEVPGVGETAGYGEGNSKAKDPAA